MPQDIPTTGSRTTLKPSIQQFLKEHSSLHLGGDGLFTAERNHHLEVFGISNLPKDKVHGIGSVEFTAIRGPHGTIPIRVLYPKSGEEKKKKGEAAALIYFHGGGYTVGSADEFENGLRMLAEESGVQVRRQPNQTQPANPNTQDLYVPHTNHKKYKPPSTSLFSSPPPTSPNRCH